MHLLTNAHEGAGCELQNVAEAQNVGPIKDRLREIVVGQEPSFDFGSAEYANLFASSGATAFQHPTWLDAFYDRLCPHRGAEKIVVTARSAATGALLLVLPLIRRRHSGVVLLESCDLGVSDYAAPVATSALMAYVSLKPAIAAALPAFDLMRIRPIRQEHVGQWTSLLGGQAQPLGFSAHAAELGRSFAVWREHALDDSFRRMLDRKKKRFLKQPGAKVRRLDEPDAIRNAMTRLARLRSGRFTGDMIQTAEVEAFYTEVAAAGVTDRYASLYEIATDDGGFGYAFGIAHAGRFNYLLIGCDYAGQGRNSPGLILYDHMIEDWIARGGKIYDFTIGDEPFKKQFGTRPTEMWTVTANATWRGRLAAAGFALRERIRAWRDRSDAPDTPE